MVVWFDVRVGKRMNGCMNSCVYQLTQPPLADT